MRSDGGICIDGDAAADDADYPANAKRRLDVLIERLLPDNCHCGGECDK